MSSRPKITKEMIVEAGFSIVREEGEEKLNVRNIAARLGCSTQPVMYCYPSTRELREDIINRANDFHTAFLTHFEGFEPNVMIGLGMNYIRFAEREKNLFRFIVLSDKSQSSGIAELISPADNDRLLIPIAQQTGITPEQAGDVFEAIFISFHGYAALIANGALEYREEHFRHQLVRIYNGVIGCIRGESLPPEGYVRPPMPTRA